MQKDLLSDTAEVMSLLEVLETPDASNRTARATMAMLPTALEELKKSLWPHDVRIETPVPDKVSFRMQVRDTQIDLLFHFRADGIYFDGERLKSTTLTAHQAQQLVLSKLKSRIADIVATATA